MIEHAGHRRVGFANGYLGALYLRKARDQRLADFQRQRFDQKAALAGDDPFDDLEGDAVVDRAVD